MIPRNSGSYPDSNGYNQNPYQQSTNFSSSNYPVYHNNYQQSNDFNNSNYPVYYNHQSTNYDVSSNPVSNPTNYQQSTDFSNFNNSVSYPTNYQQSTHFGNFSNPVSYPTNYQQSTHFGNFSNPVSYPSNYQQSTQFSNFNNSVSYPTNYQQSTHFGNFSNSVSYPTNYQQSTHFGNFSNPVSYPSNYQQSPHFSNFSNPVSYPTTYQQLTHLSNFSNPVSYPDTCQRSTGISSYNFPITCQPSSNFSNSHNLVKEEDSSEKKSVLVTDFLKSVKVIDGDSSGPIVGEIISSKSALEEHNVEDVNNLPGGVTTAQDVLQDKSNDDLSQKSSANGDVTANDPNASNANDDTEKESTKGKVVSAHDNAANNENDDAKEESTNDGKMLGKTTSTLDVFNFLKSGQYPITCHSKNDRSNFRNQCEVFRIMDGKLQHRCHQGKKTHRGRDKSFPQYVTVIMKREDQLNLMKLVHEGKETSLQAQSLSAHRGMNSTIDILNKRAWWPRQSADVKDYIRTCDSCQKVNTAALKCKDPLHSIPPPRENMRQIGVDIIQLPEADGFRFVVVAIDYLSKFCHAKALESKAAIEVARFLLEWICLFSVPRIVINDRGREFINEVSKHLFDLTGVHHRITSAYNPQANGQVERQNQVIKCGLLKVLKDRVHEWPSILDGVLFAHRTQKQRSSNFSPYFLLFGQEPILPVDLAVEQDSSKPQVDSNSESGLCTDPAVEQDSDIPLVDSNSASGPCTDLNVDDFLSKYDTDKASEELKEDLINFVNRFIDMKKSVLMKARENIKSAQNEQKKEYDKRNNAAPKYKVGNRVLLRNLRRDDRKGDWKELPWTGPYTILDIDTNGSCHLKNLLTGVTLKSVHRQKNLKLYHERPNKFKSTKSRKTKRVISSSDSCPDDPGSPAKKPPEKKHCSSGSAEKGELEPKVLPVLNNGNAQIKVSGRLYSVANTCAYDSLAQLAAVAYLDSQPYQEYLKGTSKQTFHKHVLELAERGPTDRAYELRLQCLLSAPNAVTKETRNKVTLNAARPVVGLLPHLLGAESSVTMTSKCARHCPIKVTHASSLSAGLPGGYTDLSKLENILARTIQDNDFMCQDFIALDESTGDKLYCEYPRSRTHVITGKHVYVELLDTGNNVNRFLHCELPLSAVPEKVQLQNQTFILRGVVGYYGENTHAVLGHYVAFARRSNGVWQMFDDIKDQATIVNDIQSISVKCHIAFYTI